MEIKGRLKVRKPLAVMLRRKRKEMRKAKRQISNEANKLSDES